MYTINQILKRGGTDITIDKTTWMSVSYSDMHHRHTGKKEYKGQDCTIAVDAKSRYIHAYTP